ncbi:alcohol dehydrogenase catalytic domain-containing protein [Dankookia rubra]|uniref:alcohol dehydrogenase catalytic domain-containing protein n=1 Tax=Dankookia rubra TaxID=1442381 RepID=UPI001F500A04|nr:alcohol dehydrogenase catalytic domain-containing protein [Dankookia rubra]
MAGVCGAVQVTRPGPLELVTRPVPNPAPGDVLIAVEACSICGADIGDIENSDPTRQLPRMPGHEVVGRIVTLSEGVPSIWQPGQRVGVGLLGGQGRPCR